MNIAKVLYIKTDVMFFFLSKVRPHYIFSRSYNTASGVFFLQDAVVPGTSRLALPAPAYQPTWPYLQKRHG